MYHINLLYIIRKIRIYLDTKKSLLQKNTQRTYFDVYN